MLKKKGQHCQTEDKGITSSLREDRARCPREWPHSRNRSFKQCQYPGEAWEVERAPERSEASEGLKRASVGCKAPAGSPGRPLKN